VRDGADFERDNYSVFGILQLWTSGGTAAEYIDQFQSVHDGRSGYMFVAYMKALMHIICWQEKQDILSTVLILQERAGTSHQKIIDASIFEHNYSLHMLSMAGNLMNKSKIS